VTQGDIDHEANRILRLASRRFGQKAAVCFVLFVVVTLAFVSLPDYVSATSRRAVASWLGVAAILLLGATAFMLLGAWQTRSSDRR